MRQTSSSIKAVFIAAAMTLSLSASAQVLNPANPNAPKESEEPFPLHIAASMTQTIGTGTFVLTHANNPLIATNLVVNPYALLGHWTLAASQSYDLEWTASDLTTYPNQFMWGDINFRAQYRGLSFPDYKLMTNFTMGFDLPVSIASNWQGKITQPVLAGTLIWAPGGGFVTGASLGGAYNITVPALARGAVNAPVKDFEDRSNGTTTPSGCIRRDAEEQNNFVCGIAPRGLLLRAGGFANWTFTQGWTLTANATLIQPFPAIAQKQDEFTAPAARTFSPSPFLIAGLGVNWAPLPWFNASASVNHFDDSIAATRDNARIPFVDSLIFNPARNGTTLNITTTFMY